jgi:hypothetical protein
MRSVMRVGATAGVLGGISMYLIARGTGLAVAVALVALGIVTGLGMAKWLEWSWFGRQLEAGFKAGVIACVPAGLIAVLTLLIQGPHDLAALAAASHLGPLNAARLADTLGFGGWVSADILSVVLATALGVGLAAATTFVAAGSKSARTVRRVTQAYEAAQALRRGSWGPASTTQMPAFPSSLAAGAAWQGMTSSGAPTSSAALPLNGTAHPPAAAQPSTPYAPFTAPTPAVVAALPRAAGAPGPAQPPANTPTNDDQLRAAMREALAMWGDDTGETAAVSAEASRPGADHVADAEADEQPTERRKRSPKASQFLNDAKKKGRKKTDTRDWLC